MILVDANLLVYASTQGLSQHEGARRWLDERLNGTARVGLPWPSLLAYVRLVSNPRVFERPRPIVDAWRQVEAWLDCPPGLDSGSHGRAPNGPEAAPRGVRASPESRPGRASGRARHRARLGALLDRRRFREISRAAVGEPARLSSTERTRSPPRGSYTSFIHTWSSVWRLRSRRSVPSRCSITSGACGYEL